MQHLSGEDGTLEDGRWRWVYGLSAVGLAAMALGGPLVGRSVTGNDGRMFWPALGAFGISAVAFGIAFVLSLRTKAGSTVRGTIGSAALAGLPVALLGGALDLGPALAHVGWLKTATWSALMREQDFGMALGGFAAALVCVVFMLLGGRPTPWGRWAALVTAATLCVAYSGQAVTAGFLGLNEYWPSRVIAAVVFAVFMMVLYPGEKALPDAGERTAGRLGLDVGAGLCFLWAAVHAGVAVVTDVPRLHWVAGVTAVIGVAFVFVGPRRRQTPQDQAPA